MKLKLPPSIESTPGPSVNLQFQLKFAVTNLPIRCVAFQVAPGQTVLVYPINGSTVNANPCYVASQPELLGTSSSRLLAAASDVSMAVPCDNTGQIWAAGAAGDGLLVCVVLNSVG